MRHCHHLPLLMLLVASILTACRRDCLFYAYQPVSSQGWGKTDTLRFTLQAPAEARYEIGMRVKENYPYENAIIVVERRDSADTWRHRDTVDMAVSMDAGVVLHSVIEEAFTDSMPSGTIQVLMYHVMPRFLLPGITEVGLKVSTNVPSFHGPHQSEGR